MANRNPFPEGTLFHLYYSMFTRKTALSDSELVKLIYESTGHLTTTNALQSFRYRLRKGSFPQLKGRCVANLALQPRSCSPRELEKWVEDNVSDSKPQGESSES